MIKYLPAALVEEILGKGGVERIEELHLRVGRLSSVTEGGCSLPLRFSATREVLEEILLRVTGGSIYAYRDSIRGGYIALPGGVRMGLVGRAVTEGEDVVAVTELTSLCFRVPHRIVGVAAEVHRAWRAAGADYGALVIAPPGGGKTTFLKDFIALAASGEGARRVAVVDTREELCCDGVGEMVDVLRGYPRAAGLEIALRTMSPEVLVCDEIGAEEIVSIRDVLHGGVPLVAAMHGSSLTELKKRAGVEQLLGAGVFRWVVTLTGARGDRRSEVTELPC